MVREHQSATFECEVSFDNAIVTWYKNTWELKESPKYTFQSEGRRHFMIIRNVTSADEGLWSSSVGPLFVLIILKKKAHLTKSIIL